MCMCVFGSSNKDASNHYNRYNMGSMDSTTRRLKITRLHEDWRSPKTHVISVLNTFLNKKKLSLEKENTNIINYNMKKNNQ